MNNACRQREARDRDGPPPFAGIEPPQRRCTSPDCPVPGGAVLSRFNETGLCWQCQQAGRRPRVTAPFEQGEAPAPDVELWEVVAGLLLLQRNLRPGVSLKLQEALECLGVEVGKAQIQAALKCCRRREMEIATERGSAGYVLTDWVPFRRGLRERE